MSLQASTMFDKYFKQFEGNEARGQRYQLILSTGQVFSGVPSVEKGSASDGAFTVSLDDGKTRTVSWNRLLTASLLG